MPEHNILITGAYSGIGKEFVRAYLKDRSTSVIAVDNKFPSQLAPPDTPVEQDTAVLEAYRNDVGDGERARLVIWPMDISDETQVERLSNRPWIDLVIHSAGVRGLEPSVWISQGSDVAAAEMMQVVTPQTMQQAFQINTIGTFVLLRTLVPGLRSRSGKVVIMGSRMGSIGHNTVGGGYAYRASKAALNAVVKAFSIDVPEVKFAIVHPGRVESNLVGEGIVEDGAISTEESVKDMMGLIERLGRGDSGRFMDRFGEDIEW